MKWHGETNRNKALSNTASGARQLGGHENSYFDYQNDSGKRFGTVKMLAAVV